jgi:hypothetical protein
VVNIVLEKAAKKGLGKVKPLMQRGMSYAGATGGRGFLRKKTTIKRYKSGREVVEERQSNFTLMDVGVGTAGIVLASAFVVASWGAYKFLNDGRSPLDDLTAYVNKEERPAGGFPDWILGFVHPSYFFVRQFP